MATKLKALLTLLLDFVISQILDKESFFNRILLERLRRLFGADEAVHPQNYALKEAEEEALQETSTPRHN